MELEAWLLGGGPLYRGGGLRGFFECPPPWEFALDGKVDAIQAAPSVAIRAREPEEEARTQSCISIEKGRYSV